MKALSGYKTYLIGLVTLVYAIGIQQNWWPHVAQIDLGLGGAGAITIRAALSKLCGQISDAAEGIKPANGRILSCVLAFLIPIFCFGVTSCETPPTPGQIASAPATTAGLDVASLATQATDIYNQVKTGNIDYAWAVAAGLNAYQTIIKTTADVKNVVAMFGGDATLAQKLAKIFGKSTAPPSATTAALASGVTTAAATAPTKSVLLRQDPSRRLTPWIVKR